MEVYKYANDRKWFFPFGHKNFDFKENGVIKQNDRTRFFYAAAGVTPAMINKGTPGVGSDYVVTGKDINGEYLTGDTTYKITVPADMPTAKFWSFMAYSGQTRSMLMTDQRSSGIDSNKDCMESNDDGAHTIYFSPVMPKGQECNWVQTVEGKTFNIMFRNYGPTEKWIVIVNSLTLSFSAKGVVVQWLCPCFKI